MAARKDLANKSPAPLMSRVEARRLGLPRFFTGKPCLRGHVAERLTSGGYCIPCNTEFARKKRDADPDAARARTTAYYTANREKILADAKSRAKANRQAETERHRKYVAANREAVADYQRAFRAANPELFRAYWRCRAARRKGAEGTYGLADIERLYGNQKGRCANCRTSLRKTYHIDHVQPLARGGTNWPDNLQLLCPHCNQTKHAKDPIVWAQENGRLL